jgi:hypothetical protein
MAKHIGWLLPVMLVQALTSFGQSCCNAGGLSSCGSTGLLTSLRNNAVGLRLMAVPFETSSSNEDDYKDHFFVAELTARLQVGQRIHLGFQQPYRWNWRQQPGADESLHGLADTRLTGSFTVLDNRQLSRNSLVYWELGAGLKLPTGKYDQRIYSRDLPGNLNLGMGNLGYLLQSTLVFFHQKIGLAQTTSLQLNGKSRDDYQFGNQVATSLLLFREFAFGEKTKITPLAGAVTEWFDKNHTATSNVAFGSGGYGWLAMLGLNARFGQMQAGLSVSEPFYQDYAKGEIVAKTRYTLELTRFF